MDALPKFGKADFVPSYVYVRGWAPKGCPSEQKISKLEHDELAKKIVELLPDQYKAQVKHNQAFY